MTRLTPMFNHVLVYEVGGEYYVFSFSEHTRREVLRMFGRMAADPNLNFSWRDAAILAKRVRETAEVL